MGLIVHTFNLPIQEIEASDLCEFKTNLVYREQVSKQPGLHREILSQKTNNLPK